MTRDLRDQARAAFERGDRAGAEQLLETLCDERGAADDWLTLARLKLADGRQAEALADLRRAHAADPTRPDVARLATRLLVPANVIGEARDMLDRAASAHPNDADLLAETGDLRERSGDPDAARSAYDDALRADPSHAAARFNRAGLARDQGRLDDALADYDRLAAMPDVPAGVRLGRAETLRRLGRFDAACAELEVLLANEPEHVRALICLGIAAACDWQLTLAQTAFDRAFALDPDAVADYAGAERDRITAPEAYAVLAFEFLAALKRADWRDYDRAAAEFSRLYGAGRRGPRALELAFLTMYLDVPAHISARAHTSISEGILERAVPLPPPGPRPMRTRIRVGYASNCFRTHPKMYLAGHLFASHDRDRFEVIGYDYGRRSDDPMTRRIAAEFDAFHAVEGLEDTALAQRIRDDDIDILVDLNGYSDDVRPGIFAARPAPLQLSFLGHMHSLFAPFIDYRVSSRSAEPADWGAPLPEARIFLAPAFYPYDAAGLDLPPPGTRDEAGLPEDAFVFCAFGRMEKISPATFAAWLTLLESVPGSVLWLAEFQPAARQHLTERAAARGVDPARLVFAPVVPHPDHVARHALADLYLDTFRFNAHTMGLDALHAGLPVLTLRGTPWCARIGASFLTALDRPGLIAESPEDYVDTARTLAADPGALAEHRTAIAERIASDNPFDSRRVAARLDHAYEAIFSEHMNGRRPADIDVAP